MRTTAFFPKSRKPDKVLTFHPETETTLFPFLLQVLASRSRSEIKSLMKYNHVAINGRCVTAFDTLLTPADEMTVNLVRPFATLTHRMISILYEDNAILVVEKKSGLLSVATKNRKENTAQRILDDYVRQSNPRAHVFVVHRLDQYTSGILIFAKTREVQELLRSAWSTYIIDRRYMAITENVPAERQGEISSYLAENAAMQVYSTQDPTKGKLAVTRYEVVEDNGTYAKVDVQLLTGRKNQIRVHLSEMGCPVAGDRKYGAVSNPCGRLMLHNYKLQFVHPLTRENLVFDLPLPRSFTIR